MKFKLTLLFLFAFSLSAIAHHKNVKRPVLDTQIHVDSSKVKKKQFTLPMFTLKVVAPKDED